MDLTKDHIEDDAQSATITTIDQTCWQQPQSESSVSGFDASEDEPIAIGAIERQYEVSTSQDADVPHAANEQEHSEFAGLKMRTDSVGILVRPSVWGHMNYD